MSREKRKELRDYLTLPLQIPIPEEELGKKKGPNDRSGGGEPLLDRYWYPEIFAPEETGKKRESCFDQRRTYRGIPSLLVGLDHRGRP